MVNEALVVLESEVDFVLALNTLGESMERYGELLMVSLDLGSVLVDACGGIIVSTAIAHTFVTSLACADRECYGE